MDRVPVSSSNLVSVGYCPESLTLEVEFNSGTYQYYDVPSDVFDELMASSSLGSYLHHNIKSSYSYAQV